MIKINHIAIWTHDIERLRNFYIKYFDAKSNEKYINSKKGFESYFLTFSSGARLEIMNSKNLDSFSSSVSNKRMFPGYAHLAFSLGSKEKVDSFTKRLSNDGFEHIDGPRTTGDGYYESVLKDPDGNLLEITI